MIKIKIKTKKTTKKIKPTQVNLSNSQLKS